MHCINCVVGRETAWNFYFAAVHGECVQTSVLHTCICICIFYFAVVLDKCVQTSVCTLLVVDVHVHSVAYYCTVCREEFILI